MFMLLAQAATGTPADATFPITFPAGTAEAAATATTSVVTSSPTEIAGSAASAATHVANQAGEGVLNWLAGVNWASPTWDVFIVLFFVLAVFLYGISLGRDRVVVILVSVYMALALVANLPGLDELFASDVGKHFLTKVGVFGGFFVILYFLLSRSVFAGTFAGVASGKWWQVFLFSVFHVGLLVSSVLSFLPTDVIGHLAPLTQTLFATETARFCWLVAPIASLLVVKADPGK
jgi:hypothetical protein